MARGDNDNAKCKFVAIADFFVFESVVCTSFAADVDLCQFNPPADRTPPRCLLRRLRLSKKVQPTLPFESFQRPRTYFITIPPRRWSKSSCRGRKTMHRPVQ